MGEGGFSRDQQDFIYDLIRTYRVRFPLLEITGVWDFGREEGTLYESTQRGVFADCRDNAVFNNATLSISYNHIRVSGMPSDLSPEELGRILREHAATAELSKMAASIWEEGRGAGMPPGQIREQVRAEAARFWVERFPESDSKEEVPSVSGEEAGSMKETTAVSGREAGSMKKAPAVSGKEAGGEAVLPSPGPHNDLPLEDPLFADVRAIRQLEESMNIRRLTVHELGHALADVYGVLKDRRIRKLFAACRDGFEDRDEFCAECFMASELTDAIPLASRVGAIYRELAGIPLVQ